MLHFSNKLSYLVWAYLLSANWRMGGFPPGKFSFTSNLFHLFCSNYQPQCLWLVNYLCPASLAASPDRHTAISHLTIWTQPLPHDEISAMARGSVVSWVPWMTERPHPLYSSPWRVALTVTQTQNWITHDIILAKCSDAINLRLAKRMLLHHGSSSHIQVSNINHKTGLFIITFLEGSHYFNFLLIVIFHNDYTNCFTWVPVFSMF